MEVQLSAELRDATAAAHTDAESSAFITELMQGQRDAASFAVLTAQLLYIYRALEQALREHYTDHPLVAQMDDSRLDRVAALESDLTHLVGDFEAAIADGSLPIVPATRRYAELLSSEHTAERILANHYVRYLGDLSGGQAIAALVGRHYGVAAEGLSFYRFEGIEKLKVFKDEYRARLDQLQPDQESRARLVGAAVEAFSLNHAVFMDLDRELALEAAAV